MEKYIKEFESFKEAIIFDFNVGDGGIGDYIKFLMIVLTICMKSNKRFYQKINNTELERYIRLKHSGFYISKDQIPEIEHASVERPANHYHHDVYNGDISPSEVFTFTDDVIKNAKHILPSLPDKYVSLHLRMGDKFLETDKRFVKCPKDERIRASDKAIDMFISNINEPVIFFCDNHNKRLEIKERHNNIIITDSEIGHTSLKNTTQKQTLDAVTDFYILTNSSQIYIASRSGFSKLASLFNNVPIIGITSA